MEFARIYKTLDDKAKSDADLVELHKTIKAALDHVLA